jgi:triacylglycerol lipase
MASRCAHNWDLTDPRCLFTYGSPRVGWPDYVSALKICHYRWQNNNDIVTRVPLKIMGYRHDGTLMYISHDGTIYHNDMNLWDKFTDRMKGMWGGIKKGKVDNFSDHAMAEYIPHIETWKERDV